nr:MAG TPA: hypothetical protein [Caudoviricetes sp.]
MGGGIIVSNSDLIIMTVIFVIFLWVWYTK